MNEDVSSHKKLNLIMLVLGVVFIASLIALFFYYRQSKTNAYSSQPFAQNILFPGKVDEKNLYFYTGHGLASMDSSTYTTQQQGDTHLMPENLTDLRWTKTGAAILSANYTIFDDLGKLVPGKELGSDNKTPYLWYMPFTGPPQVIAGSVASIFSDPANNNIYYTTKNDPNADGSYLKVFSTDTKTAQNFTEQGIIDAFRIVRADKDNVWALTGFGTEISLVRYGRTGGPQTLFSNVFNSATASVNSPFIMPNSKLFVALQQDGESSKLVSFTLGAKKPQTIKKNFTGTLMQGGNDEVIALSPADKNFVISSIVNGKEVGALTYKQPVGNTSAAFLFGGKYIAVNDSSQALIVSKNKADTQNLPSIKNTGLEKVISKTNQGKLYSLDIDLSNSATSNTYDVAIFQPFAENTATLIADIKAAGYDPNQLNLVLGNTYRRN